MLEHEAVIEILSYQESLSGSVDFPGAWCLNSAQPLPSHVGEGSGCAVMHRKKRLTRLSRPASAIYSQHLSRIIVQKLFKYGLFLLSCNNQFFHKRNKIIQPQNYKKYIKRLNNFYGNSIDLTF
jgi:hypothetical protein